MPIPNIYTIKAREILDCRGIPTIEVTLWLDNGISVTTSVPTGASTGKHEAIELRDNDQTRYNGMGVLKAVDYINTLIAPKIHGLNPANQSAIDNMLIELDGTENKSKLGVNAILAVSQAVCKAGAAAYGIPVYRYLALKYRLTGENLTIPNPAFNVINGGKHGAGNLDFQEFLLIPSSRFHFHQGLQIGVEIFFALEQALINKNAIHSTGVEGGFAPNLFTNLDALEVIMQAIKNTRFQFGHDVFLGLDVAANTLFKNNKYSIKDRSQAFSSKEFIEYYKDLNDEYHIFSLEDPLYEDDWTNWAELTQDFQNRVVIVGDDHLTTNKKRLQKAIDLKSCNAILIKPNEAGTITEVIDVIKTAKDANFSVQVSNRSGETNDYFIADFAVGIGAEYAKFGSPSRGERIVKYNRLLQIEQELFPSIDSREGLPTSA
jgi:enolase